MTNQISLIECRKSRALSAVHLELRMFSSVVTSLAVHDIAARSTGFFCFPFFHTVRGTHLILANILAITLIPSTHAKTTSRHGSTISQSGERRPGNIYLIDKIIHRFYPQERNIRVLSNCTIIISRRHRQPTIRGSVNFRTPPVYLRG
jgi:hypothetical protein